jgi:predicted transcriptional regulator
VGGVKYDGKMCKIGGGPKYAEENYPSIENEIRKLIDGSIYENPERVLSYTTKNLRKIEIELKANEIHVSHGTSSWKNRSNRTKVRPGFSTKFKESGQA